MRLIVSEARQGTEDATCYSQKNFYSLHSQYCSSQCRNVALLLLMMTVTNHFLNRNLEYAVDFVALANLGAGTCRHVYLNQNPKYASLLR